MHIKTFFSPAVLAASAALVVAFERNRVGALAFIAVLLILTLHPAKQR